MTAAAAAMVDEFNVNGVCIVRGACPVHRVVPCLADVESRLAHMETLPGPATGSRAFLSVTKHDKAQSTSALHRRDVRLPFVVVEPLIRDMLADSVVGAVLCSVLGGDAALMEMTSISSAPGAEEQALHSDNTWSATLNKQVTVFLALHDMDKTMGPTRFHLATHTPQCFADGEWRAPTKEDDQHGERRVVHELQAGDVVLMDALTWHGGGANTSSRKRTLLSATFSAPDSDDGTVPSSILARLADLLHPETQAQSPVS